MGVEGPDPAAMMGTGGLSLVKPGFVGRWVAADNPRRIARLVARGAEPVIGENGKPLVGVLGRAMQMPLCQWGEFSREQSPLRGEAAGACAECGDPPGLPDESPDLLRASEILRDMGVEASVAELAALEARDGEGWCTVDAYVEARRRFGLRTPERYRTREEAKMDNQPGGKGWAQEAAREQWALKQEAPPPAGAEGDYSWATQLPEKIAVAQACRLLRQTVIQESVTIAECFGLSARVAMEDTRAGELQVVIAFRRLADEE